MPPPKNPDPSDARDHDKLIKHIEDHHRHVVQVALVVTTCIVAVFIFLFVVSTLIRYFYSRRYNRTPNGRRRRDTPILFDFNGDSPPTSNNDDDVADQDDFAPVHHVWHIRTVGLQQSLIDSITVFKYRKNEGIVDSSECSVCLGEFEDGETLRLLPKCSHAFHVPCIDTWLRSHKNCPLCRAPVVRDETGAVDQNVEMESSVSVSDHQNQNHEVEVEDSDDGAGLEDGGGSGESSGGTETQPLRRSVSMDVSSASNSMVFRDLGVEIDTPYKVSSSKMSIAEKNGSSSSNSSTIQKLASFGRALQKGPVSMRRSLSHNRKFLFSTHCRSQSSTLPL